MKPKYTPKRRSSLFREASIKNLESIWSGKVILMRPLSFSFYCISAGSIVLLLLSFIFWAHYTKRESAIGFVRPENGVAIILPMVSGRVSKIYVTEGDNVKIGDPLFSVGVELENKNGSVSEQLSTEISKQIVYMQNGAANDRLSYLKQKEQISYKLNELIELAKSTRSKKEMYEKKAELLTNEKDKVEQLFRAKMISEVEYSTKYRTYLDAEIALREISENMARIQADISQAKLDLKKVDLDILKQQNNANLSVSQLNQRLIEITNNGYIVRSPIEGTVSTILVTVSNIVGTSSNVMSIVPSNNLWIAELYVPTKAIGNISENSPVYLKYDAFPYIKFGVYRGRIRSISRTILTRSALPPEIGSNEPMYRILVDLDDQEVSFSGKHFSLQSGMTLTAELEGESRRLVDWFIGPLYDMKRSFRSN